jgi:hypothetical protein
MNHRVRVMKGQRLRYQDLFSVLFGFVITKGAGAQASTAEFVQRRNNKIIIK